MWFLQTTVVPAAVWLAVELAAGQTHCKNGHPLSGDNLYVRPDRPGRQCRTTCGREAKRRYEASRRKAV